MTDTPKKVFVTFDVLNHGIRSGLLVEEYPGGSASIRGVGTYVGAPTFRADEWHLTREAAVTRANAMRDTKLASLHQQAERVKGLRF